MSHARLARLAGSLRASAIALAMVHVASSSYAQVDNESALAEGLFRSAKALVAEGKYSEACPKFAESQRLDPKLGTLMNLALCHEKNGKTATAWAEYTQAAELAARGHQAAREEVARTRARTLEALLPHLLLRADSPDGLNITLDGQTLRAAVLGTPIPIDPGSHQVAATSPGHKPFAASVVVPASGGTQTVTIPALEPEALVVAPVTPSGPSPQEPPVDTTAGKQGSGGSRVLGYSLIGAGGVAIVTGAVFGVVALSEKSAANGQCGTVYCTQSGLNDISTMKTSEAVSTLAIGAGILSAGAGVYFVFRPLGHHDASVTPAATSLRVDPIVSPRESGLSLSGAF